MSTKAMAIVIEKCGIDFLHNFPVELIYMVRRLSTNALMWKYASVIDFARQLSDVQRQIMFKLPLYFCKVNLWQTRRKF
jgi:hypothetical protein